MFWEDEVIILGTSKYSEHAAVVVALSRQYGLYHGLVKYIASKANRAVFQPGNRVQIRWQARLAEHLGTIHGELVEDIASWIMADKGAMQVLTALCAVLSASLPERDPCEELYPAAYQILSCIKRGEPWEKAYIALEIVLLQHSGFALDLSTCAVTGQTEELCYISPKTGRSVSKGAGGPYHDKLLPFPPSLREGQGQEICREGIYQALQVLGYFLHKHIFLPRNRELPFARQQLLSMVTNT